MNSLSITRAQPRRARELLVAVGLILLVALLIPKLTWADHTDSGSSSGSSYGGASCDGSSDLDAELAEACEFFSSLSASYAAGEIAYNAPGR